jgi:hypothetical protein
MGDKDKSKVIDFTQFRKKNVEQKRRQYERIFFEEFVGCYSVVDQNGAIFPIKVVDLSKTGCRIEVPDQWKNDEFFTIGSEVNVRLYFTKNSYLALVGKIVRRDQTKKPAQTDVLQFGLEFDTSLPSYKGLSSFMDFVEQFAEYSNVDKGSHKVYFL